MNRAMVGLGIAVGIVVGLCAVFFIGVEGAAAWRTLGAEIVGVGCGISVACGVAEGWTFATLQQRRIARRYEHDVLTRANEFVKLGLEPGVAATRARKEMQKEAMTALDDGSNEVQP